MGTMNWMINKSEFSMKSFRLTNLKMLKWSWHQGRNTPNIRITDSALGKNRIPTNSASSWFTITNCTSYVPSISTKEIFISKNIYKLSNSWENTNWILRVSKKSRIITNYLQNSNCWMSWPQLRLFWGWLW